MERVHAAALGLSTADGRPKGLRQLSHRCVGVIQAPTVTQDRAAVTLKTSHNEHYGHNGSIIMITETSAVSFRQNLGEMLNQVQYRHDSVVINKDGKPVAALVDARLFDRIRRMQGRFDSLCHRIEAGFTGVPQDEGLAEIDAAVARERKKAVTKLASAKKK